MPPSSRLRTPRLRTPPPQTPCRSALRPHAPSSPPTGRSRSGLRLAPALLPLLLLLPSGCGEGGEPEAGTLPAASATPSTVEDGPVPASSGNVGRMAQRLLPLEALHDSGVSGELIAMVADDAVVLIVEVEGLSAEGLHPTRVHRGTCRDDGEAEVELNPVPGLSDGTGMSTTTLEPEELDRNTSWSIRVHADGGDALACAELDLPSPPSPEAESPSGAPGANPGAAPGESS